MTDVKQVIARQMDRSGNTLMLGLEPVSDEEFFAENVTGFSAAWTVGHLSCVADLFSSWFDGYLRFGREFHRVFNETDVTECIPVSRAASVDRERYPKAELLFLFRQAMVKALRALEEFDLEQWDAPAPPAAPVSLLTGGSVWELLAVHVYWHLGELSGSMPRFAGTYTLNTVPHYFYLAPRA
jgi:hypothetical protein